MAEAGAQCEDYPDSQPGGDVMAYGDFLAWPAGHDRNMQYLLEHRSNGHIPSGGRIAALWKSYTAGGRDVLENTETFGSAECRVVIARPLV